MTQGQDQMSSTDSLIKFRKSLKEIFKTEPGEFVLEFLEQSYVESSALDISSTEITYYKLGQKEFVQGLVKDVSSDIPSEIQSPNANDIG